MFQCAIFADLIWKAVLLYYKIIYRTFYIHGRIFLEVVMIVEGNGKTIIERMLSTLFTPLTYFYTPLIFSGGIEIGNWREKR